MKEFQGKVAVVTGAASGIGRALAEKCVREGMKVVLADIEEQALTRACQELDPTGTNVLAVQTDVSKAGEVAELAKKTLERYGAVHLLFNNAGVGAGTTLWESTLADWEWTMGVNLWGVIHGVRTFVPLMLKQNSEGHIINTASIAGFISGSGLGIYKVTKHGVVTLSETLYHELALTEANIKVSVLCPGSVHTQILDSARNRPAELQNAPDEEIMDAGTERIARLARQAQESGMPPQQAAHIVFQAIRDEQFYVFTHPEMKGSIRARMADILEDRNPTDVGRG